MKRFLRSIGILSAVIFLCGAPLRAGGENTNYAKSTTRFAAQVLTFPFEVIRWPIDQTLVVTEKYHLDDKAFWFYNQMLDRGVSPYFNNIDLLKREVGLDVEWLRLTGLNAKQPDASITSWLHYAHGVNLSAGTKLKAERIHESNFYTYGSAQYENRPEEHFYGIGPDTSKGDGTSFRMETTQLTYAAGYQFTPFTSFEASFGYRNVNITNGEDGGRGEIDRIFPGQITGLGGDELLAWEMAFSRDTRDHEGNSTKGSLQKLQAGYYEGLGSSEAGFFKLAGELAHFFQLGSEDRVLVTRALGEHRIERGDKQIPFHQMSMLGGYGAAPRLSHTLRGYSFNRFFDESLLLLNLEYRYSIWQRGDMRLQTVAFFDEGQVFGEWSEMQIKDFKESYGGGFRFSVAHLNLLSVEIAHGDEGTAFYVKSNMPF